MMVGYAQDHPKDSYRLYFPHSEKVKICRDVVWEHKTTIIDEPKKSRQNHRSKSTSIRFQKRLNEARPQEASLFPSMNWTLCHSFHKGPHCNPTYQLWKQTMNHQ